MSGAISIGSKARSLRHQLALLLFSVVILGLLYYLIEGMLGSQLLAAIVLIGAVLGAVLRRVFAGAFSEWAQLFRKDSAYGTVEPDGIRYHSIRGWQLLKWHNVQRVDYWPENESRLEIHVLNQDSPLRFGPTTNPALVLQLIQQQLDQVGPNSEINIRDGHPASSATLQRLTKSQKWLARGVVLAVFLGHEGYWWFYSPRPLKPGSFVVAVAEATMLLLILALLR
jgi:ABC-type transport system substrate-binding protein